MQSRSFPHSSLPEHVRNIVPDALQEYLEAVRAAEDFDEQKRNRAIMQAQAELLFHATGGAHCAKCPAHVRHVIRVTSLHVDGGAFDYDALCTRCLVAEEAVALQITFSLRPEQLNVLIEVLNQQLPAKAVAA